MKRTSTTVCLTLIALLLILNALPFKTLAQQASFTRDIVRSELSKRDAGTQVMPQHVSQSWYNEAVATIEEREFFVHSMKEPGTFSAVNHPQHLGYLFFEKGYAVGNFKDDGTAQGCWHEQFLLTGIGRDGNCHTTDLLNVSQKGDRNVQYDYTGYAITYSNEKNGMEQQFLINNKPAGKRDLQINMQLKGDLDARISGNSQLLLYTAGHPDEVQLAYDQFEVWDKNHQQLPAHMQLKDGHNLTLVIDDRRAVYPLTVDPLNHTPGWTGQEGALLGLSSSAIYGFSITGNIDINNDGITDIAIGAPTYAIITAITGGVGSFTLSPVGAVFIYLGGSSISTIPSKVLQPVGLPAGALFGFSVASAGDINGDTHNDLIVGAPGDNVVALSTVGGPVNVATGKAYIYTSTGTLGDINTLLTPAFSYAPITAASFGAPPLLSTPATPAFGWSVSGAGDVNGDGAADVVVGAPYFSSSTVTIQGMVDIFQSTGGVAISASTVPNTILSNSANWLLGFSLAKGNLNGDVYSDIIVGAPGSLLPNGTGNVYIYYGSASGITATGLGGANVSLVAPSVSGLGNDLTGFGFSVANAMDLNGDNVDDVIIGAPFARDNSVSISNVSAAGKAYIYYSSGTSGIQTTGSTTLSSPRGPAALGSVLGNLLFGYSVAGVGDANLDGHNDVVVGEPGGTLLGSGTLLSNLTGALSITSAAVLGGQAYMFTGTGTGVNTTTAWTLDDPTASTANFLGAYVANLGDVNNDGHADFVVGAPSGGINISADLNVTSLVSALNMVTGSNTGSAYTFFASASILPVTLLNFSGSVLNSTVVLDWSTSMEENSDHFEIDRSIDNSHFTSIGQVAAQGNSSTTTHYTFTDQSPVNGVNYYRLKMVDKDGQFTYSRIIAMNLNNNGATMIGAYPNPAHGSFSLVFKNMQPGQYRMALINTIGQELMAKDIELGNTSTYEEVVPLSGLAQGTYWVKVVDQQSHTFLSRIVVQ